MLRTALISPNYVVREKFGECSDPPLGIAYIASALEKKGHEVTIIDANAENLGISEILSKLKEFKPDVAGISCNYSPLHNSTLQVAAMIKEEFMIPVIVGGNHATAMSEYLIDHCDDDISIVVRGEGEEIVPRLLEAIQGNIKLDQVNGITYKEDDIVVSTRSAPLVCDLDVLPMPAYHLLPMERYIRYNIIASRGCPYDCTFCAAHVIFERKVRYRSPKNVVDEIEHLLSKYGKKHFWFSDDTFTKNTAYLDKLMDEFSERRLDITWSCLTRVNLISKDILSKMKKTGCTYISYGVESGNREMLSRINKKISLSQVRKALQLTREAGLRMYTFFLVGNQEEDWETITDSYELIMDTEPDGASFAVVIPLPGTKMWDDLINDGLIDPDAMQWDYLFAKMPGGKYEDYAASLASRWCKLRPPELITACKIGETLPLILQLGKSCVGLKSDDMDGISKLYSSKISSIIKERDIFMDTMKMYLDLLARKGKS